MTVRVVIQSRLDSSRLPGKAMLSVAGRPLVRLVAERAAHEGADVVVATSEEAYDDVIERDLRRHGLRVVRGPLDDVLGRFVLATQDLADDDWVVRLTADNPVANGALVNELVADVQAAGRAYGRIDIAQVPEGLGAEAFTAGALRLANARAHDVYDREHVTPWLRRHHEELLVAPGEARLDRRRFRCTVDALSDYDLVARLFQDEPDPIGVSWQALLARVGELVPATAVPSTPLGGSAAAPAGRLVPTMDGVARWDRGQLREALRSAVAQGVTHVAVEVQDAACLHRSAVPALAGRLTAVLLVPATIDLRNQVERALGALGHHLPAEVVVVPDLARAVRPASSAPTAGRPVTEVWDQAVWDQVHGLLASGAVRRAGARAADLEGLARATALPGLSVLQAPAAAFAAGLGRSPAWGDAVDARAEVVSEDVGSLLSAPGTGTVAARVGSPADLRRALGQLSEPDGV
ncbi:cytidylyltransferase domain-containing protein [Pedococcus bigeumensis]|uniref:Cytidylyltransferase n=1 Tax=Pedococcus bigeumensis TaxID=433644 RepID=A0A502CZ51_9MICO|nr:NTP transferase domain-containing protein [Pedococcus bigeumensis]TPG18178.1 cytidylyltransferase [Pedococcus bigeumensis]